MISDEGKGKGYVEEQSHGGADDRDAEAVGDRSDRHDLHREPPPELSLQSSRMGPFH
jgi:hypothetical protein